MFVKMKASRSKANKLSRCVLLALLGSLCAFQATASAHDHGEPTDSMACPCVLADKVEWSMAVSPILGESIAIDGASVITPLCGTLSLGFFPVLARSPPLA